MLNRFSWIFIALMMFSSVLLSGCPGNSVDFVEDGDTSGDSDVDVDKDTATDGDLDTDLDDEIAELIEVDLDYDQVDIIDKEDDTIEMVDVEDDTDTDDDQIEQVDVEDDTDTDTDQIEQVDVEDDMDVEGDGEELAEIEEDTEIEEDAEYINAPPVIDLDGTDDDPSGDLDFEASFTEGDAPVLIVDDENLLVSDDDNTELVSATITILNLLDGASEMLAVDLGTTDIQSNYDAENGVLLLDVSDTKATASLADFQTVLRSITYINSSITPSEDDRNIEFIINDGLDDSAPAFCTLSITSINTAPTITDVQDMGTVINQPKIVNFTIDDVDTDVASLSLTAESSNLNLVENTASALKLEMREGASGLDPRLWKLTITPTEYKYGTTIITLTVDDGDLQAVDTFELTVADPSNPPVISPIADFLGVSGIDEDTSKTGIAFSIEDTDTAPTTLIITASSSDTDIVSNDDQHLILTKGSAIGDAISYTLEVVPLPNAYGIVTITIKARDLVNEVTEEFELEVRAVNDQPVCLDKGYEFDEDNSLVTTAIDGLLVGATDADNEDNNAAEQDTLIVEKLSEALDGSSVAHGTLTVNADGTFTYVPEDDYFGVLTFTYRVDDQSSEPNHYSEIKTVTLTINAINDKPEITPPADQVTLEDTTLNSVSFTVEDLEDNHLLLSVTAVSSNQAIVTDGNIQIVNGAGMGERLITITPNLNANTGTPDAPITITITVKDTEDLGNVLGTGEFDLTVTPVNDAPVAFVDGYGTDEEIDLDVAAPGVLLNDTDIEDDSLTAVLVTDVNPLHGTLTLNADGSFLFDPALDFDKIATFEYKANDGDKDSAPVLVTITMNPINDPPTITPPAPQTTPEDTDLEDAVFAVADVDDDPLDLTVTATSSDQNIVTDLNITITAGDNDSGRKVTISPIPDANTGVPAVPIIITLTVHDPHSLTGSDTFELIIEPRNDPPTVGDDEYFWFGNTYLDYNTVFAAYPALGDDLLANDSDQDGDDIEVIATTKATDQGGSITFASDGSFEYTPPVGFVGDDTVTYQCTDIDDGNQPEPRPGVTNGTITFHLATPIWYVDNMVGAGGDGSDLDPFNTLADAETASDAGDVIFMFEGDYTVTTGLDAGITLKEGQSLFGQGVALTVYKDELGGDVELYASASERPLITNLLGHAVTLADNNSLAGFDIDQPDGCGLYGRNIFGTLDVSSVLIDTSIDYAIKLDNAPVKGAVDMDFSTKAPATAPFDIALENVEIFATRGGVYFLVDDTDITLDAVAIMAANFGTESTFYLQGMQGNLVSLSPGLIATFAGSMVVLDSIEGDVNMANIEFFGSDDADVLTGGINMSLLDGNFDFGPLSIRYLMAAGAVIVEDVIGDITFDSLDIQDAISNGLLIDNLSGTFTATNGGLIAYADDKAIYVHNGSPVLTLNGLDITQNGGEIIQMASVTDCGLSLMGGTLTSTGGGNSIYFDSNYNCNVAMENATLTNVGGSNLIVSNSYGNFAFSEMSISGSDQAVSLGGNNGGAMTFSYNGEIAQNSNPYKFVDCHNIPTGSSITFEGTGAGLNSTSSYGWKFREVAGTVNVTNSNVSSSLGHGINIEESTAQFTFDNINVLNAAGDAVILSSGTQSVAFTNSTLNNSANAAIALNGTTGGSITFNNSCSVTDNGGNGFEMYYAIADVTIHNFSTNNSKNSIRVRNSSGTLNFVGVDISDDTDIPVAIVDGYADINITGTIANNSNYTVYFAGNTGGLLTIDAEITDDGGKGVYVKESAGDLTISNASFANSPSSGINIANSSGNYTFTGTEISNANDAAIRVTGNSPTVSYNGAIANSSDYLLNFNDTTGGSISISGGDITDNGGMGINIVNTAGDVNLHSVNIIDSTRYGINVENASGVVALVDFSIDASSGILSDTDDYIFRVANGSPTVSWTGAGTITGADYYNTLIAITGLTGGSVNLNSGAIDGLRGGGVLVGECDAPVAIANVRMDEATANGTQVRNCTSDVTFTSWMILNPTNSAIKVSGGTPVFSYAGDVIKTGGDYLLNVENTTGGSVNINGADSFQETSGKGILVSNSDSQIDMNYFYSAESTSYGFAIINGSTGIINITDSYLKMPELTAVYVDSSDVELTFIGNIDNRNDYLIGLHNTGLSPMLITGGNYSTMRSTGTTVKGSKAIITPKGILLDTVSGNVTIENAILTDVIGDAIHVNDGAALATHTFNNVVITNPTGDAFDVLDSNANIAHNGAVTNASGYLFDIKNVSDDATHDYTGTYTGTAGTGTKFSGFDGTLNLDNLDIDASTTKGIYIANSDGTISFTNASLRSTTEESILVEGGNAIISYNGIIYNTSDYLLEMIGTGGSFSMMYNSPVKAPPILDEAGTGIRFYQTTADVNLANVSLYDSTSTGIQAIESSGTHVYTDMLIDGSTGHALYIAEGDANVEYNGDIMNDSDFLLVLLANTGGSTTINAGTLLDTADGIKIINDASTLNFNGDSSLKARLWNSTYTGIYVENSTGSYTFTNTSIDYRDDIAFLSTGGSPTINYTGRLDNDSDWAIVVYELGAAGSVSLTGSETDALMDDGGSGVLFESNEGPISLTNYQSMNSTEAGLILSLNSAAITVNGFTAQLATTYGLLVTGSAGTLEASNLDLSGCNGGMHFENSTGTYNFNGVLVESSSTTGVSSNHSSCTINFTENAATNRIAYGNNTQLYLNGSTPTFNYSGEIVGHQDYLVNLVNLGASANVTLTGTGTHALEGYNTAKAPTNTTGIHLDSVEGTVSIENLTLIGSYPKGIQITDDTTADNNTGTFSFTNVDIDGGENGVAILNYKGVDPAKITFEDLVIGASTGTTDTGFYVTDSSGAITANNISVENSATAQLELNDFTGTMTLTYALLDASNGSNEAVTINGGTPTLSYFGDILSTGGGGLLYINGATGGSVTFNGFTAPGKTTDSNDLVASSGGGINIFDSEADVLFDADTLEISDPSEEALSIAGDSSATYTFNNAVINRNLPAPAKASGWDLARFSITGNPTITYNGTITDLGTGGLYMLDISTMGGSLTVNGDLLAGAGSDGLRVQSTSAAFSFSSVVLGTTDSPLTGTGNALILRNNTGQIVVSELGVVTNAGNGVYIEDCANVDLYTGEEGTIKASVSGLYLLSIDGNFDLLFEDFTVEAANYGMFGDFSGLAAANGIDTANLEINNNNFKTTTLSGLELNAGDYVNFTANITGNTFNDIGDDALKSTFGDNSLVDMTFTDNGAGEGDSTIGNDGVDIIVSGDADVTLDISSNTIEDAPDTAIIVEMFGTSTNDLTVNTNAIANAGVDGIQIQTNELSTLALQMDNNIVESVNFGVYISAFDTSVITASVQNNLVESMGLTFTAEANGSSIACFDYIGNTASITSFYEKDSSVFSLVNVGNIVTQNTYTILDFNPNISVFTNVTSCTP